MEIITEDEYLREAYILKRAFSKGLDSQKMKSSVERITAYLQSHWTELNKQVKHHYFNMSLCAELLDQFGEHHKAVNLLSVAAPDMLSFEFKRGQSLDQDETLREIIRLYAVYAMIVLYRKNDFKVALERIEYALKALKSLSISKENLSSLGTTAQIFYMKAMCLRKLHQFNQAEEYFRLAIHKYFERARKYSELARKDPKQATLRKARISARLSQHRTSIVMAKLAWMMCQQGRIARAETCILIAQQLLLYSKDELQKSYINMIHASIIRNKYSNDYKERQWFIQECSGLITQSEAILARWESSSHYLQLLHEKAQIILAEAQLYRKNNSVIGYLESDKHAYFEEVEQIARKLESHGQENSNTMIVAKAYYLRVLLYGYDNNNIKVVQCAEAGLQLSGISYNTRIDFLLSCADSYLNMQTDLDKARKYLDEVFTLNSSNKHDMQGQSLMITAQHVLLSAKLCIMNRNLHDATEYIHKWEAIKSNIEINKILLLGDRVTSMFKDLSAQAYIIDTKSSTMLNYEEHNKAVKKFLISQAYAKAQRDLDLNTDNQRKKQITKEVVATHLGISRTTLIQWEKDLGSQPTLPKH